MSAVLDEPVLFKGANQALRFAFGSSAVYGPSAIAQLMGRVRSGNGLGLVGNDRASQSGMILDMVSREVDELHWVILVCRCAPTSKPCECGARCCRGRIPNMYWESAISALVLASISEFSGKVTARGLREHLVKAYFGGKPYLQSQVSLAKRYGVDTGTVGSYESKIRHWLQGDDPRKKNARTGEENRAWYAADEVLTNAGIIDCSPHG